MRLTLVTQTLNPNNGYGRFSSNLATALLKRHHQLTLLTSLHDSIPEHLAPHTFPGLLTSPTSPLTNPFRLYHDWRFISHHSHDSHAIHFLTESFLATTILGYPKPYFVTAHGTWALRPLTSNWVTNQVFTRAYQHADQVICVSRYTQKLLESRVPGINSTIVYTGIKLPATSPKPKTKTHSSLKILTVANLNQAKGLDVSLAAISQLPISTSVKYTVVSGKHDPTFWNSLTSNLPKPFLSHLILQTSITEKQLRRLYSSHDIFLLTPVNKNHDFEGFGLVFLEAAAYGLPSIASNSGALSETLNLLKSGILVRESNPKDIVNAIQKLTNNPKMYQRLSHQAIKASRQMSLSSMVKQYESIYSASISNPILKYDHPLQNLPAIFQKIKWDLLARVKAHYFIYSSLTNPNEALYKQSGRRDSNNFILQDRLLKKHLTFSKISVLEIGCGNGRMTQFIAPKVRKIFALDISPSMISLAKQRLRHLKNTNFIIGDGQHYPLKASQIDLVFSFIVFQHFPTKAMVNTNLHEINRVLKKRGLAKVQLRTRPAHGGPFKILKWYYGVYYSSSEIRTLAQEHGFKVLKLDDTGKKQLIVWLQK